MLKRRGLILLFLITLLAAIPFIIAPSQIDRQLNSHESVKFYLNIDGLVEGYFTSVDSLGSESEVVQHKVMENKETVVRNIPGRISYKEIHLTRTVTTNMDLANWRKEIEKGNLQNNIRNGEIILYNQAGEAVANWALTNVWPAKLIYDSEDGIFLEKITLVCDKIERTR